MSSGSDFLFRCSNNIYLNNKVCLQYKSNRFEYLVNGISYSLTQGSTTPSGLVDLSFDRGDGTRQLHGNTKQLQYFDSALTDSELEQLTSWTIFFRYGTRTIIHNRIDMAQTYKFGNGTWATKKGSTLAYNDEER